MAAPVVAAAGKGAMRLMSSKWFWIILGSIVAFIIIRRYWQKMQSKVESRLGPQYGDWQEGTITSGRKSELESYASDVYEALACFWCNHLDVAEPALAKIAYLNDNELEYVARYYEQYVSDDNQTLYEDVDEEWLGLTSVDDDLLHRLSKLGLK